MAESTICMIHVPVNTILMPVAARCMIYGILPLNMGRSLNTHDLLDYKKF